MARGRNVVPLRLWPGRVVPEQARARVEDSGTASGMTARDRRTDKVVGFAIPTDATAMGRTVRTHEALHGLLEPWKLPQHKRYHPGVAQVIEDIRVQLSFPREGAVRRDALATTAREAREVRRFLRDHPEAISEDGAVPWQIVAALARHQATLGTTLPSVLERMPRLREEQGMQSTGRFTSGTPADGVQAFLRRVIGDVSYAMQSDPARRDERLRSAADALQTMLQPEPGRDTGEEEGAGSKPGEPKPGEAGEGEGEGEGSESGESEASASPPGDPSKRGVGTKSSKEGDGGKGGEAVGEKASTKDKTPPHTMTLDELLAQYDVDYRELVPRTRPTRRMRSPGWNPGVTGTRLRMALAGRALAGDNAYGFFRRRKASQNRVGTVLIDASGSMGVTQEGLLDLMETAPGATIAFYSGSDGGGRGQGTLAIWSRQGRCYNGSDRLPLYGGNGIDLPAVVWLLKQEGPHVFVTDRGFCGGPLQGSSMAHAITARNELLKGLTVIPSLAEAKLVFAEAERTGRSVREAAQKGAR